MIEMKHAGRRNEGELRGCCTTQLWLRRISTLQPRTMAKIRAVSYHEYLACETEWLELNSATLEILCTRLKRIRSC